ncbi:Dabb family protein [Streptomyces sp. NPDC055051]|uniref:Dabb family protein n=1 Tax=Streptomyces sp. NPDC014861 TaxID=3364923 RepID=UPI003701C6AF
MISHIVCFRFLPGVTWDDPRAVAAERISRGHPRHIPDIVSWTAGRNTTSRDAAHDFAVVGLFEDRDALERYQVHPDHRRGVRAWGELSTWVVVDLDDTEGASLGEPSPLR